LDSLIIVGIIILVAGLIAWSIYAQAKRRKELTAWASKNGLSFYESRDYSLDEQYPTFSALTRGANRYAYNHITGRWNEHDFHGFDYHYETYSTDSKGRRQTHHHHFSVLILSSPVPLQQLLIRPEGFFDKVTEFFGHDDIDFESIEFSKRFYVKAPEKRWAYDVLHQRAMEFLLNSPEFTIQFGRDQVIAFRNGKFKGEDYEDAAKVIKGLIDRMPEYVVNQQLGTS